MPISLVAASRRRVNRSLRKITDRVMAPYVAEIVNGTAGRTASTETAEPAASEPSAVPSNLFHNALHELRTVELERVPKGAKRVLSVGANGRWYFDWFEASVGPVERHVGVEAFEDKPDDLPEYVDWVVNTADHMDAVEDGSIDLVFAGQTTEHLWAHELTGFLLEAHRVLAPSGMLVLDSPNRLVTEHLHWSHGGHTIELSAEEIEQLLGLAGFTITTMRGVWSCVEAGRRMELEEGIADPGCFVRRAANAADRPDDSFVWFLVAERDERQPDAAALATAVDELFERHWPTRMTRGMFPVPGAAELPIPAGAHGVVGRTLPYPMHAGTWTLTVRLARGTWADVGNLAVRIVLPSEEPLHIVDLSTATIDGTSATWTIEQPFLLFALSLEVVADGVRDLIAVELPIDLRAS
jgi:SAM-dependent methyltransferase